MIIADISAWVEYDRASESWPDLRLRDLIVAGDRLAVTKPVVMEVCAGARDDRRERDLRRLLQRCALLPFDGPWRTGATILACDVDLDRVAGVVGIPIDDASLRAR